VDEKYECVQGQNNPSSKSLTEKKRNLGKLENRSKKEELCSREVISGHLPHTRKSDRLDISSKALWKYREIYCGVDHFCCVSKFGSQCSLPENSL